MRAVVQKVSSSKVTVDGEITGQIKQQEQLFNSGYGSEQELLQAKIERNTAQIELEQNKLTLAGACSTAAFLCNEKLF